MYAVLALYREMNFPVPVSKSILEKPHGKQQSKFSTRLGSASCELLKNGYATSRNFLQKSVYIWRHCCYKCSSSCNSSPHSRGGLRYQVVTGAIFIGA